MAIFSAHVIVHGESGPVQFVPGDDVPEWADGLVGDHVLTEPSKAKAPAAEAVAEESALGYAAPDFTGAKPTQRRTRK